MEVGRRAGGATGEVKSSGERPQAIAGAGTLTDPSYQCGNKDMVCIMRQSGHPQSSGPRRSWIADATSLPVVENDKYGRRGAPESA